MKSLIKLFILFCSCMPSALYGQPKSSVTYKEAVALFMKSDKQLTNYREYIKRKNIFMDPLGYNLIWYKTIAKESPDLFRSTDKYKGYLLQMLKDSSLKKGEFTDAYIVRVLYNLCLEDYIDIMDSAYVFFKNKQISSSVFIDMIFQDPQISDLVARNYKDERLQLFLRCLQKDNKLTDRIKIKYFDYKQNLNDLISGKLWNTDLKENEKTSPPLLKHENCK